MNKVMVPKFLAVALMSTLAFGCANNGNKSDQSSSSSTVTEKSAELEKVGYSIGYATAESYKESLNDLNLDTFEQGFRDAYGNKKAALTKEQMQEVMTKYEEKKQAEMMEKMKQDAVKNKAAGDKFLAENAKKEGVKTTASGLQYKEIKPGTGKPVGNSEMVKINYEGKLLDGTVFDSSYDRGEPVVFPVEGMIPGFTEGLKLMKEGGTYELYIPADLAYGETGNSGIDPNSTLIFKVEMIEVNPKMPAQPAQ
ncbi:FKBP-type peptidyl-prolyl cis-trans isomerase [Psychrobacter sanguinis]|uniref:FKBP-type peptidyl-prolyl cis-trans isomerase n=1 Tax=Psychrobacter sanguinis TaxID=861445 RepID=UPI001918E154|nr:FKBP-type peptidyl-prolyl cis-trans isomerase [Psychrobacter sanguinis]MCC3309221.1 FKBP-type peptidyl-prolyl cis-trans isomerase [Psychrobacter sanguinis]MCC3345555.1 FKBP-type peptidyl-prolyl cis-trans isomerase [Psychrobacter sanguinis]MDY3307508.1 FKBP-type peptidyl-prolyl cis-trans isomerase [Psychrobacter sanguinis]UEC26500.1 FKBP-type peptidyl-prolyl cis-trans isomerase [Psychrobacter sanguinis]